LRKEAFLSSTPHHFLNIHEKLAKPTTTNQLTIESAVVMVSLTGFASLTSFSVV